MRRTGGWAARRRAASAVTGIAVVALVAASMNGVASAAPAGAAAVAEPAVATNLAGPADVDHRTGSMKPTAAQASAAAKLGATIRWNAYGTPATLGPATLATGLAKDPVAAAKEYLTRNTALFGLDAEAVDALDHARGQPARRRRGRAAAAEVRLTAGRQRRPRRARGDRGQGRPGDQLAVPDDRRARAGDADRRPRRWPRAMTDAKIPAGKLGSRSTSRAVAVPTAQGPPGRVRGDLVAPDAGPTRSPTRPTSTAAPARVLVREDQVDFDSDNPRWAVFPATPPPATPPPARTPG